MKFNITLKNTNKTGDEDGPDRKKADAGRVLGTTI